MSMDGAREGRRRNAYRKISRKCACGRQLHGNLSVTHMRTCQVNLEVSGWPMDAAMKQALLEEYGGRRTVPNYAEIVRTVEKELGVIYLARRAAGDKTPLGWNEYRDTVWRVADQAVRT